MEPGVAMPWSQHSCTYPGCGEPLPPGRKGRCDKHPYPDAHDPDSQKLYNTRRWKRRRAAQLAKQPWCEECLRENIFTPATDVDHIERHRGDPLWFFTGSLQSLCHNCHSRKTAREVGLGRGDQNVLTRIANSGRGLPYEKKSPIETQIK